MPDMPKPTRPETPEQRELSAELRREREIRRAEECSLLRTALRHVIDRDVVPILVAHQPKFAVPVEDLVHVVTEYLEHIDDRRVIAWTAQLLAHAIVQTSRYAESDWIMLDEKSEYALERTLALWLTEQMTYIDRDRNASDMKLRVKILRLLGFPQNNQVQNHEQTASALALIPETLQAFTLSKHRKNDNNGTPLKEYPEHPWDKLIRTLRASQQFADEERVRESQDKEIVTPNQKRPPTAKERARCADHWANDHDMPF